MNHTKLVKFDWLFVIALILPLVLVLKQLFLNITHISDNLLRPTTNYHLSSSFYVDHQASMTLEQVINQPNFTACDGCTPPVEFGHIAYWYKLNIISDSAGSLDLTLFFDNPMLDNIDLYQLSSDDNWQQIASYGDQSALRDAKYLALPHHMFQLAAGDSVQFIIRSQTTGAPSLPLVVSETRHFTEYMDMTYLLWGGFIAIVISMALYNLILYQGVKEPLFLYYVSYIILFLFELGIVHGYLAYLLPNGVFQWVANKIIVLNFLLSYTTLLFAQHFLRFSEKDGLLFRLVRWFALLSLGGAFISLFLTEYVAAQIYFVSQAALYLLALSMVIARFNTDFVWARYYFISWAPLFTGAVIGPMLLTGQLEYNFWTRHALLLGVMFEMTFISMAIAERLKQSEQARYFQTFHDPLLGVANLRWLEQLFITKQSSAVEQQHTLLFACVNNYQAISPYLEDGSQKSLFVHFLQNLLIPIQRHFDLLTIDSSSQHPQVVCIRENVFVFIIPGDNTQALLDFIQQQSKKWDMRFTAPGVSINVGCSLSISVHQTNREIKQSISQGLHALDAALTNNKLVSVYTEKSESDKLREIRLAADLLQAIEQQQLTLYHQPQVDIKQHKVIGSEVLLRWEHPIYGTVSPMEFVTIAERSGTIGILTRWVVETALSQLKQIDALDSDPQCISINISALDLHTSEFVDFITTACKRHRVSPQRVILELTETVSFKDSQLVDQHLTMLREVQFGVAIDDFGCGYASFGYVNNHIFSKLKIDKQFIQGIHLSPQKQSIVSSIITMANNLQLQVLAEGTETTDEILQLHKLNCELVQGYGIAKPMPADRYLTWLEKYHASTAELV